jgi:hypothetical protein
VAWAQLLLTPDDMEDKHLLAIGVHRFRFAVAPEQQHESGVDHLRTKRRLRRPPQCGIRETD